MSLEGRFSLQPFRERPADGPQPRSSYIERATRSARESRQEAEADYWLNEIVNPEKVERARYYPLCEGWSTERIILEFLLGKIVEQGTDLDPIVKLRLRNLIGVFRIIAFPNMSQDEQEFLKELSQATTVDFKSLEFEATPEVQDDMRWIWRRFSLQIPESPQASALLTPPQE